MFEHNLIEKNNFLQNKHQHFNLISEEKVKLFEKINFI